MNRHVFLDKRSLAWHTLWSDRIRHDKSCLLKIRKWINLQIQRQPQARVYYNEWLRLLDSDIELFLSKMKEDSEHGQAMRQCTPIPSSITSVKEYFSFNKEWLNNWVKNEKREP